jgi:TRAP transporter TAXI family solute receptor
MKKVCVLALAAGLVSTPVMAKEFLKMGSVAPGMSIFTINTTFANIVNKYVKDIEIQVSATGTATRHQLLTARGRMDVFMSSPIGTMLLVRQIGPYKKVKNGKELAKNLRHILTYEAGPYHFVTYDSLGIKTMADLKGKKVFVGPPGGAATRNAIRMIKLQTGMVPGKDYEKLNMGWSAAIQAFQDKKFDVLVFPTNPPSPAIQQIALTNKLRLLPLDLSKMGPLMRVPGRTIRTIPAGIYGKNVVNTKDVTTLGAVVGIGVRAGLSDDLVYRMTKAFWSHLKEVHATAPWMKYTINRKAALSVIPRPLHPGAAKYYKEAGFKIGRVYKVGQKWDARKDTLK